MYEFVMNMEWTESEGEFYITHFICSSIDLDTCNIFMTF